MKSRTKITGFGRMVIFLLILAPIAYFAAKYIASSGILDSKTEKMEEASVDIPTEEGILEEISRRDKVDNKNQEEIIAEQRRKIEELERQNRDLQSNTSDYQREQSIPPPPPSTTTETTSGKESFDDILREADDFLRNQGVDDGVDGTSRSSTNETSSNESTAIWTFSFSGTTGEIQLYIENERIISRTSYTGTNRVDVSELVQQGDKLVVKDSPSGEYYILKSNGDLDAFDRNGFQTTCRRK